METNYDLLNTARREAVAQATTEDFAGTIVDYDATDLDGDSIGNPDHDGCVSIDGDKLHVWVGGNIVHTLSAAEVAA